MSSLVTINSIAAINPTVDRMGLSPTDIVPFVAMADVSNDGQIINVQQRRYEDVRTGYTGFCQGDILLAKITPCFENGKCALVDIPGDFNVAFGSTEFHVLRPNKGVYPRYLFHALNASKFRFLGEKAMTGAAGQKRVPVDFISNFKIPLPLFDEQRRIAAILDKADAIRRKRQKALKLADDLVKSQFIEMFGDPVTNPKKWAKIKWNDLFNTTTGKLDSNAMIANGKYPFFTCAKEAYRIDEHAFDCEALLLAGNNAAGVYDVKHYDGKFNAYQRTYVITLKNQHHSYSLFKIILEQKLKQMQTLSKGTNTKYLTMAILGAFDFIAPPLELQNNFTSFVRQADKSKFDMQRQFNEAEMLFSSLNQQYFG